MKRLEVLYDFVLIEPKEEEEKKGGIILPSSATETPNIGTVVATGEGRLMDNGTLVPLVVKKGDLVLFRKFAGSPIQISGEEGPKYTVMKESEIIGRIFEAGN
jgi:chaperonin GroES